MAILLPASPVTKEAKSVKNTIADTESHGPLYHKFYLNVKQNIGKHVKWHGSGILEVCCVCVCV